MLAYATAFVQERDEICPLMLLQQTAAECKNLLRQGCSALPLRPYNVKSNEVDATEASALVQYDSFVEAWYASSI